MGSTARKPDFGVCDQVWLKQTRNLAYTINKLSKRAYNKDTDQPAQMHRQVCSFVISMQQISFSLNEAQGKNDTFN